MVAIMQGPGAKMGTQDPGLRSCGHSTVCKCSCIPCITPAP